LEIFELKLIYYPQKSPKPSAISHQPSAINQPQPPSRKADFIQYFPSSAPFSILHFQFSIQHTFWNQLDILSTKEPSAISHQPSAINQPQPPSRKPDSNQHSLFFAPFSIFHFQFSIPPAFLTIKLFTYLS